MLKESKTRLKEKQRDAKERQERKEEVGMDPRSGIPFHPFF